MKWNTLLHHLSRPWVLLGIGLMMTAMAYWPGLTGTWLFDDYPNIVDNPGVHITDASVAELTKAALSSPASDFKRPLASLSFAINYLATGTNAPAMKITNLFIHLLNGIAAFLLLRSLLRAARSEGSDGPGTRMGDRYAALMAAAWLVLPINISSVLYIVQRMESMANFAVLLGLWGYIAGRQRMLNGKTLGLPLATISVVAATAAGALAKETAVLLPLYAALVEIFIFRGRTASELGKRTDKRIVTFFIIILFLPLVAGAVWLTPGLLNSSTWVTRDFTLDTRLLSEARIVMDYIAWTILPTPRALSFYHDDFVISQGILSPPSTALSIAGIAALLALAWWLRNRIPLAGLGIALYFGCHLLTGTVLPLELVYEHRNYFSSMALILALGAAVAAIPSPNSFFRGLAGACLGMLMFHWIFITWMTSTAWGNPLALARELAYRAPESPRAQYELGRTYIIYSNYDSKSPFIPLVYEPLEHAARIPGSSVLPEQALIFMTSRMNLPVKDAWWQSIESKLKAHPATIQDESSLDALAQCLRDNACHFPAQNLLDAFGAALSHDRRSPRLLAMYANFAFEVIKDHDLAYRVQTEAVEKAPNEPAYRITLARIAMDRGNVAVAKEQLSALSSMNIGGRLSHDIDSLRASIGDLKDARCAQGADCQ
ncbi:hypothetical protein J2X57_003764 [Luteibacter sp. 1214]|uniref:hypothetical protein n=1 Tax=Luteibacter sp. 1214 TaxID=2817735 RepID=UPI002862564D|nr:hypothetical protein [Luteibacter sp. 1214]MDR6644521.1 hypothetical protein [Luteibacter sp. 1214]